MIRTLAVIDNEVREGCSHGFVTPFAGFAGFAEWRVGAFQLALLVQLMLEWHNVMLLVVQITFERIMHLKDKGLFKSWLTSDDPKEAYKKAAMHEAISIYDHSMAIKLGVHVHLW